MDARSALLPTLFGAAFIAVCSTACHRTSPDSNVVHRDGQPDVVNFESDDAEMNAAIAEAQRTIPAFLQTLSAPKANQEDFSVKRPYATKDGAGHEHIWISHLSYDGTLLHGTVGDEPVNIANLKFRDPVSFSPSELTDWMYMEDRKIVGGYTIRVVRKHMPADEAAEFDKHLQFKP